MAELTALWRKRGYDLDFGAGIALGYATCGEVGFESRSDYAAIGAVTNLASRLADEATAGQILISQRLYAEVEDEVEVEPAGEFTLKGFRRPVAAFNVIAVRNKAAASLPARSDYAAIGSVTNLASRLADEATAGQVLISQRLHAEVEDHVEVEPAGGIHAQRIPATGRGVQRHRDP